MMNIRRTGTIAESNQRIEPNGVAAADKQQVQRSHLGRQSIEGADREWPRRWRAGIVGIGTDLDRAEASLELVAGNEGKEEVAEVRDVERPDHPDGNDHGTVNRGLYDTGYANVVTA